MWYIMSEEQRLYELSERLVRAITGWQYTVTESSVEDLIRQGAQVNRLHGTLLPLHCACMVDSWSYLHLLLEHGAEVNLPDGYGRCPIHYAAERSPRCLDILLAHGAQPDSPDPNHDMPLHWAAFKNNHRCVEILLRNQASVNVLDNNGDTPICWAAMKGNLESVKLLLDYNAKVDVVNCDGKSPVLRVCTLISSGLDSGEDIECLELLLEASGQVYLSEEDGRLPQVVTSDNRLTELLIPCCISPRSLKNLSRRAVRGHLATQYLPELVAKLPLPRRLQRYVLLQES